MVLRNKAKIGILGYGEVGQAVAKFYKKSRLRKHYLDRQVRIKDLKRDDGLAGIEILHICIPWNNNFIKIAKREIKEIRPKLIIIHSTVAPGTTKKLIQTLPKEFKRRIVHSPIRGIHPYLHQGIKTFMKYIGADDRKSGDLTKKHFKSLGIKSKVFHPLITTEIAKLLDTTYYGLCIAWHGEMKKICDKFKINYKEAITDFNKTYNKGYKKLGKSNVIRPVLYPPKDGIGGHCIIPNVQILRKYYRSELFNFILKYKRKTKIK
jgi:UDP-N-acetyl-D-mannosaminuronate dehydrogenase